jgi:hypothetical protein
MAKVFRINNKVMFTTEIVKAWLPNDLIKPLNSIRITINDTWDLLRYNQHPTIPPPPVVKFKALVTYRNLYQINILIETGTFEGEMVRKCHGHFREIFTIELDEQLVIKARQRLSKFKNIHIIQGNSADKLSEILAYIKEPALFWLDAHYSGGITAKGDSETPLMDELRIIGTHAIKEHIILIDDARLFGSGDYPEISKIKDQLYIINPNYKILIESDILRAYV